MRNKNKNKSLLLALILSMMFMLSGCSDEDVESFFVTESTVMKRAEKLLEDKYGEEFVVHDAWDKSQLVSYVTCSPKNNENIVFEATVFKDGSKISEDQYLQGVIANKLTEKISPELEELFDECYVKIRVPTTEDVVINNPTECSIEEYVKACEEPMAFTYIFVDCAGEIENGIDEEYNYFSHTVNKYLEKKEIPNTTFIIFYVDKETQKWCEDYFSVYAKGYSEFREKIDVYSGIGVGYSGDSINTTYEEYKQLREEKIDEYRE